MKKNDARNILRLQKPFKYETTKENKIIVFWNSKRIKMCNQKESLKFLNSARNKSEFEIQLLLARLTGHFKHGNER